MFGSRNQPRRKSSTVKSLFVLLALMGGVASGISDHSLVNYYNDFARKAYIGVVANTWDKYIEKLKEPEVTDAAVAAYLKDTFIPSIEQWNKIARETHAPSYAEQFHSDFAANTQMAIVEARKLQSSFEKSDVDEIKKSMQKLTPIFQHINDDFTKFVESLKTDKKFTFESTDKESK